MIVEPVEVSADRPEPEQCDRVAALREDRAQLVEALEETLGNAQSGSQPST